MTELQEQLLKMLKEIDVICRKHNITYYLIGGSALGAVRHHGFIPWDDDADIVMTRDNWIKFESVIDQEIRPDRRYMTWRRTENYPAVFARYTNTETTCIVNSLSYSPIQWGLMIDIFVLTPIPNSPSKRRKFHNYMKLYGEILNPFFPVNAETNLMQYKFWKMVERFAGKKWVLNYLYKKIYSYNEDECTHYSYSYPRVHVIYPKEIFQTPRYVKFEDTELPIPTEAEEHFRILFGDLWMMLPQNRESEHNMIVDLKRPYTDYVNDYWNAISVPRLMKAYQSWKLWRIGELKRNNFCKTKRIQMCFLKDQMEFEAFLQQHENDVKSNYINNNLEQVNELLKNWYAVFTNSSYMESSLLLNCSEDILEIFIYMLHRNGRYDKADKIINLYIKKNSNMCYENIKRLQVLVAEKRSIQKQIEKTVDIKQAQCTLIGNLKKYPEDSTLLEFYLHIEIAILKKKNDELEKVIKYAIQKFPENGTFYKYYGDFLYLNNKAEAIKKYKIAMQKTENGIVLSEIMAIFKENTKKCNDEKNTVFTNG